MPQDVPQHIAIIPDGNRRWARDKNLPAILGHKKGADNFEKLADYCRSIGVKCVTMWVFSTENWKRSKDEIESLFELVRGYMDHYKNKCIKEKINFLHIGRKDRLPQDILDVIAEMEEKTKSFTDFTICLAADYGGHDEIIRAIKKMAKKATEITEELLSSHLDTAGLPALDLIIRPGGEYRLSGFMTWQSEYAEYYYTPKYFPDFSTADMETAISNFSQRERRFGGNIEKKN